jgi:hypothetical protein
MRPGAVVSLKSRPIADPSEAAMSLSFPNTSRSYDPARRRVRFFGRDSAAEIPFFIEEDALFRLNPRMKNDESAKLATFDSMRARIEAAATGAHARGPRSFYVLAAMDF